jgi:hypothetical protein
LKSTKELLFEGGAPLANPLLATKLIPQGYQKQNRRFLQLAATAYGEGSLDNVFKKIAAITNVIVRQRDSLSTTCELWRLANTYDFAAS